MSIPIGIDTVEHAPLMLEGDASSSERQAPSTNTKGRKDKASSRGGRRRRKRVPDVASSPFSPDHIGLGKFEETQDPIGIGFYAAPIGIFPKGDLNTGKGAAPPRVGFNSLGGANLAVYQTPTEVHSEISCALPIGIDTVKHAPLMLEGDASSSERPAPSTDTKGRKDKASSRAGRRRRNTLDSSLQISRTGPLHVPAAPSLDEASCNKEPCEVRSTETLPSITEEMFKEEGEQTKETLDARSAAVLQADPSSPSTTPVGSNFDTNRSRLVNVPLAGVRTVYLQRGPKGCFRPTSRVQTCLEIFTGGRSTQQEKFSTLDPKPGAGDATRDASNTTKPTSTLARVPYTPGESNPPLNSARSGRLVERKGILPDPKGPRLPTSDTRGRSAPSKRSPLLPRSRYMLSGGKGSNDALSPLSNLRKRLSL